MRYPGPSRDETQARISYKISAKAKGTSNTLKMNSLVPPLLSDNILRVRYQNTLEFRLMQTIHDNSINIGSILGCSLIGVISQSAAASVSGLRGNNTIISDNAKQLFQNLISSDSRLRDKVDVTLRNISYLCEKKLVEFTKGTMVSQRLTNIVKDILNNEIFFTKMDIDNGVPRFTISSTTDRSISNLHFRTKNGYDSTSDKLGFKL